MMKYTKRDWKRLVNLLRSTSAKWKKIGLQLELEYGRLAAIQKDYPGDVEQCLAEVIIAWLESGGKTTQEQLQQALSQIDEKNLAQKLCTLRNMEACEIVAPSNYLRSYSNRVNWLLISVLCLFLSYFVYESLNKAASGRSSSLTQNVEELVGRSTEIQEIIKHINSSEVQVFNLFGAPGMGKSTIAKYIGHAMLKQGTDVHYIIVEHFQGIDALTKKLMRISNSNGEETLEEWARNLKRQTLLILDNVDGSYWVQDNARHDLRSNFIDVLQSNSRKVKILITSQIKVETLEKYRSYRLKSLDDYNCIILLQNKTTGTNISSPNAQKICRLVGGVPLIIKVLSSALSLPDGLPVDYVIQRIESPSKLHFISTQENRVSESRSISALELSLQLISKECLLSSLLLVKQKQEFHQTTTIATTATKVIQQVTGTDFHIEECIHELTTASLLEEQSLNGRIRYEFHTIVRSYLEQYRVNNKTLLSEFWKLYFDQENQSANPDYYILNRDHRLTDEDAEVFFELIQIPEYSNIVALKSLHNGSFVGQKRLHKKLQTLALKILNCPSPELMKNKIRYAVSYGGSHSYKCEILFDGSSPVTIDGDLYSFKDKSCKLAQLDCDIIDNEYACSRIDMCDLLIINSWSIEVEDSFHVKYSTDKVTVHYGHP